MRLSAWIFASDLILKKQTFFDKWVKKNIFEQHSPKEVFEKLKSAGVDGIELLIPVNFSIDDYQYIKEVFEKNKVTVNSIHQPLRLFTKSSINEIKYICELAHKFHARVVVLHLSSAGSQVFNNNYLKTLKKFEKKYDIKIGFENHQKHFVLFHKKYLWDSREFSSIMKTIQFGITFDTTHLATTKSNIIQFFQDNKESIVNIHISDYKDHLFSTTFRPALFTHMSLGKGQLPIKEFLETLKKDNYKGLITMEINTNLEGLCESAEIIKKILISNNS